LEDLLLEASLLVVEALLLGVRMALMDNVVEVRLATGSLCQQTLALVGSVDSVVVANQTLRAQVNQAVAADSRAVLVFGPPPLGSLAAEEALLLSQVQLT
jgi:secreted trypsin-like serine protease